MSKFLFRVIALNIVAMTVLAFVYPHLVIAPGKLTQGHQAYETDCFACHSPFFGASSEKCTACHKVEDIGILTTKGLPVEKKDGRKSVAFHQGLLEDDCVACHTDHAGMDLYRIRQPFSHQLLAETARGQCNSCHAKPTDGLHKPLSRECGQCHGVDKWKPAAFKHDLLSPVELADCVSCHRKKTPPDELHRKAPEQCGLCHGTDKWKPAKRIKHDMLSAKELRNCQACHAPAMPKDRAHQQSSKRCGNCHFTDKWKPAKERSYRGLFARPGGGGNVIPSFRFSDD